MVSEYLCYDHCSHVIVAQLQTIILWSMLRFESVKLILIWYIERQIKHLPKLFSQTENQLEILRKDYFYRLDRNQLLLLVHLAHRDIHTVKISHWKEFVGGNYSRFLRGVYDSGMRCRGSAYLCVARFDKGGCASLVRTGGTCFWCLRCSYGNLCVAQRNESRISPQFYIFHRAFWCLSCSFAIGLRFY